MNPSPAPLRPLSPQPRRTRPGLHWLAGLLGLVLGTRVTPALPADASAGSRQIRFGVSQASFGARSVNDASAALKAWASMVAKERKISARVLFEVLVGDSEVRAALDRETIDAVTVTFEELLRLETLPDQVFLTARGTSWAERYIVLVQNNPAIHDVSGLKGRKLVRHASSKTIPALPWLDAVIPNVFFLRRGYDPSMKAILESALQELHETPSGRQVLAVFQCDRMQPFPASCLEPTRLLLAERPHPKPVPVPPSSRPALTRAQAPRS